MRNAGPENRGEIILYRAKGGKSAVEVRLKGDSVWLNLNQMAELFERDKSVISRHLRNIYESRELVRKATVAKNATVQLEGKRHVQRQVEYFNLDAILSVGYRVNSKRGTQFRIWATSVLKDHLVRGYTLNQKRLKVRQESGLKELEDAMGLVQRAMDNRALTHDEGQALLHVVTRYARSWALLQRYDEQKLTSPETPTRSAHVLGYEEACKAIVRLKAALIRKREAAEIFGQEREDMLQGILGNLKQTFDGQALYPGIEETAAHLLYFIIKDHPFIDGNKRIGSFLFLLFLDENNYLQRRDGRPKIDDNALVALALLIAESDPVNKEVMIQLIMNLLWEGEK